MAGLGLEVVATPFKGSGRAAWVALVAHVTGLGLRLGAGQQLALSWQALDLNGRGVTGGYKVFGLTLERGTRDRVADAGLRYVERIAVRPGRYELRVVAEQPGGALGSVVTYVDASDPTGPLPLSGLVLGSGNPMREVPLAGDPGLRAMLGTDLLRCGGSVEPTGSSRSSKRTRALRTTWCWRCRRTTPVGELVARREAQPVPRTRDAAGFGFRAEFDLSHVPPGSTW